MYWNFINQMKNSISLGSLADPYSNVEKLNLKDISLEQSLKMLKQMIEIRKAEEEIAELVESGEVKCPCHFAIGQEAPAVGVAYYLVKTDRVFGAHRSHAHYLTCGGDIFSLFAEVLGRVSGSSKGMGGSMHLYAGKNGFAGSVPIVGGTVPLAVGAALASKLDGKNDVGVAFFGDGACEEGIIHESLNLASIMKLPVIFVVENNLYSSHLDINLRQPSDRTARFAEANMINTKVVDGNNIVEVSNAARELIKIAREGGGPGFIEAVTYRWLGHVGANPNVDVGLRRSQNEIKAWKKLDPIKRLIEAMVSIGQEESKLLILEQSIANKVKQAMKKAMSEPFPENKNLLDFVYSRK